MLPLFPMWHPLVVCALWWVHYCTGVQFLPVGGTITNTIQSPRRKKGCATRVASKTLEEPRHFLAQPVPLVILLEPLTRNRYHYFLSPPFFPLGTRYASWIIICVLKGDTVQSGAGPEHHPSCFWWDKTEKRILGSQLVSTRMVPVLGHFSIMSSCHYAIMRYCRYGVLGYCYQEQKWIWKKKKKGGGK